MFDFDKIQSKKEVTGSKMVYINTTLLTVRSYHFYDI